MGTTDNRPFAQGTVIESSLINAIVYHRIHLAICALCALWCSSSVLHVEYSLSTWLIVTLAIVFVYQVNRVTDFKEDSINAPSENLVNRRYENEIKYLSLVVFATLIVLLLTRPALLIYSFPLLALGILYNFRFLNFPRLKTFPVIKNLVSAFGWSFATVLFPSLADGLPLSLEATVLFMFLLFGVFSSEIIWDIRDMDGDKLSSILTIPTLVGYQKTRILLITLNAIPAVGITVLICVGQLPLIWSLFLLNDLGSVLWACQLKKLEVDRRMSHQILVLQITILIIMALAFR